MAKTIRNRLTGLLAYWKHAKLTSASQERFNNKIGWLTRQAYGYHDEKYLHLNRTSWHEYAHLSDCEPVA